MLFKDFLYYSEKIREYIGGYSDSVNFSDGDNFLVYGSYTVDLQDIISDSVSSKDILEYIEYIGRRVISAQNLSGVSYEWDFLKASLVIKSPDCGNTSVSPSVLIRYLEEDYTELLNFVGGILDANQLERNGFVPFASVDVSTYGSLPIHSIDCACMWLYSHPCGLYVIRLSNTRTRDRYVLFCESSLNKRFGYYKAFHNEDYVIFDLSSYLLSTSVDYVNSFMQLNRVNKLLNPSKLIKSISEMFRFVRFFGYTPMEVNALCSKHSINVKGDDLYELCSYVNNLLNSKILYSLGIDCGYVFLPGSIDVGNSKLNDLLADLNLV